MEVEDENPHELICTPFPPHWPALFLSIFSIPFLTTVIQ